MTNNYRNTNFFYKLKEVLFKKKTTIIITLVLLIIFGLSSYLGYKTYKYDKCIDLAQICIKRDNFDEAINNYRLAGEYNLAYNCDNDINNVNKLKDSKLSYKVGIEELNKKNYDKAVLELKNVIPKDKKRYSNALKKLKICENINLDLAKKCMQQKDYEKAMKYLSIASSIEANSEEINKLYSDCSDAINKTKIDSNTQALTQQKEDYSPQKIVDSNGKQIWKIYISSGTLHFTGTYKGNGNFIVKLSDNNQNMIELIANEIGDYVADKTVSVSYVGWYYLEIDGSDGKWNYKWE